MVGRFFGSGLGLVIALAATTASAQEKISFTVAAGQPPRALPSLALVGEFFIPEVNKRLKEQGVKLEISWKEAYAGSLLKPLQMLDGVKDGLADIGYVPTIFYPDKLPLENMTFAAPFLTNDVVLLSRIMNRLHENMKEFPAQYDRFNQIRLAGSGVDSYELLTTFPVRRFEDLKGKKIAGAGGSLPWLKGIATPVQGNMMEYYNSTKTGVYEGFIVFPSAFPGMKYPEVAPHVTKVGFGAQYAVALTINKSSFKKLPPPAQKIFMDVAQVWALASDRAYMTAGDSGYKMLPDFKANLHEFSREEQVRWAKAMPNIAKEWAASMDKQKLPGTKAMAMLMQEARAAGIKPVRDWDKD